MFNLDLGNLMVHLKGEDSSYKRMMHSAQVTLSSLASKAVATGKVVAGAVAGLSMASVGLFARFDDAMVKSTAIMGNLSEETKRRMRDVAIALSKEGVQSAKELADSYFFLASAGLNAEQSIGALPVVQKFATAGAFDMAQATDLLTDAQSALGITSKDTATHLAYMTYVGDMLVKANVLANASVSQFSKAITNEAGAAMKNWNIQLDEGVAILAAYADQGTKSEEAGSSFGRLIRLLTQAYSENEKTWKEMKIELFDDEGFFRLTGVIQDLERELGSLPPEAKAATLALLGFEARSQQVILPLLGASEKIREYNKELKNAAGTTQDVTDKQLTSFIAQWKMVWHSVTAAGIAIGAIVAEYLPPLAEFFKRFAEWVQNNEVVIREWIESLARAFDWLFKKIKAVSDWTAKTLGRSEVIAQARERYKQQTGDTQAFEKVMVGGGTWGAHFEEVLPKFKQEWAAALRWAESEYNDFFKDKTPSLPKGMGASPFNYDGNVNVPSTPSMPAVPTMPAFEVDPNWRDKLANAKSVEDTKMTAGEITDAIRSMYDAIGRMTEDSYNAQVQALETVAQKYRDNAIDAVLIEKWKIEEIRKLNNQLAKDSDNFFAGFKAGIDDMKQQLGSYGQLGYDVSNQLVEGFGDVTANMTRNIDSVSESLRRLGQDIAAAIAKWATMKLITTGLNMLAPGSGTMSGVPTGATVAHSGGVLGHDVLPIRSVSSDVFTSAVRAHNGLMPNERPIVARNDEAVLTPEQMRMLGEGQTRNDDVVAAIRELEKKMRVTVVAVDERPSAEKYLKSRDGQRQVVTISRKNRTAING
jgi:TP901 family phage tail tape measure protein